MMQRRGSNSSTTIHGSTELMKNHKAAKLLTAESSFEAVQTQGGNDMLFLISNERNLNLVVECPGSKTGWIISDLSSKLSTLHGDKKISVQKFSVRQNKNDSKISIALVVQAGGESSNYMYALIGMSDADGSEWMDSVDHRMWTAISLPGEPPQNGSLAIHSLLLGEDDLLVVQVLTNSGMQRFFRYLALIGSNESWEDAAISPVSSILCQELGQQHRQDNSFVPVLYQLTNVDGSLKLSYSDLLPRKEATRGLVNLPVWLGVLALPFIPVLALPSIGIALAMRSYLPRTDESVHLKCPEGATMISALLVKQSTHLFVAAQGELVLFAEDNLPNKIISNPIISGVQQLHSHSSDKHVVIWGLNQRGDVFYSRCDKDSVETAKSWSYPLSLLSGVAQISSFVNPKTSAGTIFAHTKDNQIIQLTQDSVTTHWHEQSILLPSLDINDVAEYNSYTSHFQLTKDNSPSLGTEILSISTTSPCSMYINDVYHTLKPGVPTPIKTDAMGSVTIVQEARGLKAVCYQLELSTGEKMNVNPMSKIFDTISLVKSGSDLGKIRVPDGNGGTTLLVSPSVTPKERDDVARSMQQFVQMARKMPQDGSMRSDQSGRLSDKPDAIWGLSFENGTCNYHEDAHLETSPAQDDVDGGFWDTIEAVAGDVWHCVKHAFNDVKNFVVKTVKNAYHFIVNIGGKIFRFILKCFSDVAHAAVLVFNKIGVFFEDLVNWLGFYFEWDDILRTHNVLKNIIRQYIGHSVGQIDTYKKQIATAFEFAEKQIGSMAGLHESTKGPSLGEITKKAQMPTGMDLPQAHWGIHHLHHNVGVSSISTDLSSHDSSSTTSGLEKMLNELKDAIQNEGSTCKKAYDTIKDQIIGQMDSLSVVEIIKLLLGVLGDFLLDSVKNIVEASLDVFVILIEGVLDILDATIEIPVISWMYNRITGNQLTLLDALCLVSAIPSTIVFKIAEDVAPYPDDSFTKGLIHADSWMKLQHLFQNADDNTSGLDETDGGARSSEKWIWTRKILHLASSFSSFVFIGLSGAKTIYPTNPAVSILHALCFYTTRVPPFIASVLSSSEQTTTRILGEIVFGITVIQKCLDIWTYKKAITPTEKLNMSWVTRISTIWSWVTTFLDCFLGVLGLIFSYIIPVFGDIDTIGRRVDISKDTLFPIAGAYWNLNRILSPVVCFDIDPDTKTMIILVKMGLIAAHGVVQGTLVFYTQ